MIAAVVTSVPILFTMLIAILPIKERVNLKANVVEKKHKSNPIVSGFKIFINMLKGMKDLITFPPFVFVAIINIVGGLTQALVFNNINLWVKYWVAEETKTNLILTVAQIGLIIGVVFFSLLAKKITKKWSLTWGSILGFVVFVALFFVQPHQLLIVFVLMFVGSFYVVIYLLSINVNNK